MRRSLGLEIGAAELRWVELEEERGRVAVRASGATALAGGHERSGGRPGSVAEALKVLAGERRWRGREVVVSLPRSAVTLRWVTLPHSSREETAGMVELEAVQSLPFSTEEAAWDFVSFPEPDGRQEVLVVAARRQLVQEVRREVEAAGLRVGAVAVDALALTALYRELLPEAETTAVLLHVEGESATLSSICEGRLLLSRSVSAERLDAGALAVELRRTLVAGMMTAQPPEVGTRRPAPAAVNAVWLTGESADTALAEELGAILSGSETGAGDRSRTLGAGPAVLPGRAVHVALLPHGRLDRGEALSPAQDTALGLALLGLRSPAERLDLARGVRVDTDGRAAGQQRRLPLLLGAVALLVVVGLALVFGPSAGDRELAAAASRAQADARKLAAQRQQLESQVRMLSGAIAPAHSYLDVLNEVSALSGPDVWLTQYTYQRGRPIVIRGTARSNDAVARLVEGLRRSPHLERVALGSVTRAVLDKKSQLSVVQFTITGSLLDDQPLQPKRSRAPRAPRREE